MKRLRSDEDTEEDEKSQSKGPNVLKWDNKLVLEWLQQFKFGEKYIESFKLLKIDGPTLIKFNFTTLESILFIYVKTHVKKLSDAIDHLRLVEIFTQ